MWRGGCIIRSVFLGNIKSAYDNNPDLTNLLLDDFFRDAIHSTQVLNRKFRKKESNFYPKVSLKPAFENKFNF